MAKKSSKSKSSRRTRTKKELTDNKSRQGTAANAKIETSVQERVTETKSAKSKSSASKKQFEETQVPAAVVSGPEGQQAAIEEMVQPQRRRMLVNAVVLGVVVVALVLIAAAMRQPSGSHMEQAVKSGGDSSKADEILQSGGSVCTNGPLQADMHGMGSTNPESVGMMLQNVPANNIQTPQTTGVGNDISTLQGAACF